MKGFDQLTLALHSALPGVRVEQLQTSLPSDDSGLWFVRHPNSKAEVNVESHNGEFPFLIENSRDDMRITAATTDEAVAAIRSALGLSRENGPPDENSLSLEQGNVRAWIEQESIHIIAKEYPSNDPVELTPESARRLADALIHMAGKLHG